MIVVPKAFADSTIAREGERGAEWVASLPRVVSELCADWHVKPVGPVLHGYVAVVVPVDRDGEPIMLKVSWIDRSSEQEALVLRAWNGDGAVRLLAAREDLGAMLLEGLEADRTLEHVAIDDAVRTASTLLRRLAIPAPAELRTVTEELSDIRESLPEQWERAGRPFGRRLLDASLDAASPDASGPTLRIVNQDLHYGNVLAARREPWLVIDPKALAGDPEFGVAQLLWTRFDELGDRAGLARRLDMVIDCAGLDARLARRLVLVRAVESWLWSLGQDLPDDAGRARTLIDWVAPGLAR